MNIGLANIIWEKTGKTVHADGSSVITYYPKAAGVVLRTDLHIESRKRAMKHANRGGVWFYTSYFVVSGTDEKEYWSLTDAKAAAEERIRGTICKREN